MENAVQSVSNTTSIAQVELANMSPEEQAELLLQQETTMPEDLFQKFSFEKGFLICQSKYYGIHQENSSALSQKLQSTIHDLNQPKEQRELDLKASVKELKFSDESVKTKELKTSKSEASLSRQENGELKEKSTAEKTKDTAHKNFSDSKENQAIKPFLATNVPKAMPREGSESVKKQEKNEEKEEARNKPQTRSFNKEDSSVKEAKQPVEKQQEKDKEKEKERQGFAEDQKQRKNDENDEEENKKGPQAVTFEKEFISYANQDSILSQLLNMRTSQFDVLILFLEIMKLAIKSREAERMARMQERELELYHMEKVVANFKQQGKYQLIAGVGSGIFAIISGMCPIVGHLKSGDWIKDKLSYLFKSMKDMDKTKLFKSLTKMTFAMSEMQKSMGQIQYTFAESSRTFDQHMMEIHRVDADENTRTMEDIKDHWKSIENFVYQTLQMYHEAIRQLYS